MVDAFDALGTCNTRRAGPFDSIKAGLSQVGYVAGFDEESETFIFTPSPQGRTIRRLVRGQQPPLPRHENQTGSVSIAITAENLATLAEMSKQEQSTQGVEAEILIPTGKDTFAREHGHFSIQPDMGNGEDRKMYLFFKQENEPRISNLAGTMKQAEVDRALTAAQEIAAQQEQILN